MFRAFRDKALDIFRIGRRRRSVRNTARLRRIRLMLDAAGHAVAPVRPKDHIDPGVVDVRGEVLARLASAQDTGHEAGAFLANFAADLRRSSPPGRASERGLNREAVV